MDRKAIMATALLVMSILLLVPSGAFAAGARLDSSTYLIVRESLDTRHFMPLYEYVNLSTGDMIGEDVSFNMGGWARADLGASWARDDSQGKLQYAFLEARADRTSVRIGRVMVMEGIASVNMDGIYIKGSTAGGFGISVFGGVGVDEESGDIDAGAISGARIGLTDSRSYSAGVSFIKQDGKTTDVYRNETGLDIWLRPASYVQLSGISAYDSNESEWAEHSYYVTAGPFANVRINGHYEFVDYGSFFKTPTLSVFTTLDADEELSQSGLGVDYALSEAYVVRADYTNYAYSIKGDAESYGASIDYGKDSYRAGMSVNRMSGQTDDLSYYMFRAYTYTDMGGTDVAIDFVDVNYDREINGLDNAYSLSAALGFGVSDNARAGFDVEYSRTPFFDREVKVFCKLNYVFSDGGER